MRMIPHTTLGYTHASEYAEQGMPIDVTQRMLGHCSLQMSLHYAKVSDNVLYQKWKETEALGILQLDGTPPGSLVPHQPVMKSVMSMSKREWMSYGFRLVYVLNHRSSNRARRLVSYQYRQVGRR